ncbi:hypothetical protein JSY36_04700 [Bacillus sp. H-16]|uniref:hypothetical protein n=1 Tax=Alteribacter salitolerans TaxID=2912333 RepID=UPI0019663F5C|nr:hypothetical protein [Alteribacter salitolerans]MBM7095051.1 hypothetical protein [Alteribacter salitolerans]
MKIRVSLFIALCLCIVTFFTATAGFASETDTGGVTFPERENSNLSDTNAGDDAWGPESGGGFQPGGNPNTNTPGPNGQDPNDPNTNTPEGSENSWMPEWLRDRVNDARDVIDGFSLEGARDWIVDGTKSIVSGVGERINNRIDNYINLFEWTKENVYDPVAEGLVNLWNEFSPYIQDLIKSIVNITLVIIGAAGLVALSIIGAKVAVVAGGGAIVLGGTYFLLFGGTDNFNMFHSLLWTVSGGLAGGAAGSGLLAAAWAAARGGARFVLGKAGGVVATMKSRISWLFTTGKGVLLTSMKGIGSTFKAFMGSTIGKMAGGFLKSTAISGVSYLGLEFTFAWGNFVINGEPIRFNTRELLINTLFYGSAGAISVKYAAGIIAAKGLSKLRWFGLSGVTGGSIELFRNYALTGVFDISNFIIGFGVGLIISPVFSVLIKLSSNKIKQIEYEAVKILWQIRNFSQYSIAEKFATKGAETFVEKWMEYEGNQVSKDHPTIDRERKELIDVTEGKAPANLDRKYYR